MTTGGRTLRLIRLIHTDDLDALIGELNATAIDRGAARRDDASRVEDWLAEVVRRKGSDLLLVAGSAPAVRVDGLLHADRRRAVLDGDDIEALITAAACRRTRRGSIRDTGIADASLRVCRRSGRFRVNLHHERGRAGGGHPRAARPRADRSRS